MAYDDIYEDEGIPAVVELINDVFEAKLEAIPLLETSYEAFDYGNNERGSKQGSRDTLDQIVKDDTIFNESSLTRKLVMENVYPLSVWARDERSIDIDNMLPIQTDEEGNQIIAEEGVSPTGQEQIEARIRENIKDADLNTFFTQLLVSGFAVASVGLNDDFYVPNSTDTTIDYLNNNFVYMKRELDSDTLNDIANTWGNGLNGGTIPLYNSEDMTEVEHGQLRLDYDKYVEFIRVENVTYFNYIDKPVIFWQVFSQHPDDCSPMGVYRLIEAEELSSIRIQRAISSRTGQAIGASLLVKADALDRSQTAKMYKSQVMTMNPTAFNSQSGIPPYQFVPSRVEEILIYRDELARLELQARRITGLFERTAQISTSQTSATESLIAYENSTLRVKTIISNFTDILGKAVACIAYRDFNVILNYTTSFNPLDEAKQLQGLEKILPDLISRLEADPTGEMFGGAITEKTVYDVYTRIMKAYKLPVTLLNDPQPTRLTDEAKRKAAEAKEETAANRIARAEELKAEAENRNSQTNVAKVVLEAQKHKDETELKAVKMLLDAKGKTDEVDVKRVVTLLKAQEAGQGNVMAQLAQVLPEDDENAQ